MKLSEAIRLGVLMTTMRDAGTYCGCALALGLRAVLREEELPEQVSISWYNAEVQQWPWLKEYFSIPQKLAPTLYAVREFHRVDGEEIISTIFYRVERGELTLEELVQWVESVEPVDVPAAAEAASTNESAEPAELLAAT